MTGKEQCGKDWGMFLEEDMEVLSTGMRKPMRRFTNSLATAPCAQKFCCTSGRRFLMSAA